MSAPKFDADGLVPVIVQDHETNEVLMMAYANEQAYRDMLRTGYTHFYSRSRQAQWRKGETSGHVQEIVSIQLDCDGDALLVRVRQTGVACHLGRMSCFDEVLYGDPDGTMAVLPPLLRVIRERRAEPREGSYTCTLFADENKRLKKVVEEAGEVLLAAKDRKAEEQAWEVADLVYHLLVAVEGMEVTWEDVYRKLAERRR
ncbi:MAG TPA: bifunctional phosphoribosyl-AMP cyclohydrolase/phosphoribosyl-ATP diphosphatase HisIE [Methanomassiliicoccales archaeon]|jgi:phosphoribosyl-ATP pyrophosphohydrolase/phosphoribosyl-AMP cyclohydrolase|nr:bifunctional phosphoribosyl-AMP cyclohydrolase/phosphoribosyl-ATP diphosphatase HisIE [Methanomassiliicoccales archaeon]HRU11056.1 bifunctional phosphoribosyl-AMP cyclohydrolase/phosphoribosyl-ATP diphosphatase HisIE [Methanomassiliicoccales archaeon]